MEDNKEQYRLLCKEADSLRKVCSMKICWFAQVKRVRKKRKNSKEFILYKKLSSVLQDNDACRKAQERMEAQIYAQQQELAEAQKEIQLLTKQKRDLEKRLEIEVYWRSSRQGGEWSAFDW